MIKAPLPPDEAGRLKALESYAILDTPPEQAFDDLAVLASQICGTPTALIVLLDGNRQWFKARVGLTEPETDRDVAFCAHTILQPDVLIVEDTHKDPRFATNPLVTSEPQLRFYAGTPLKTPDGQHALGTLCVLDREPRTLTPEQTAALKALARQAQAQLELRRTSASFARANQELHGELAERVQREVKLAQLAAIVNNSDDAIIGQAADGKVFSWNPAAERLYGYTADEAVGQSVLMLAPAGESDEISDAIEKVGKGEHLNLFRTVHARKDGSEVPVSVTLSPIRSRSGEVTGASMIARNITERIRSEEEMRRALEMQVAANEQLKQINAIKSDFVSVVSHEFRTPLTVIQGFSEMISQEELGLEEIREYASDIHRESFRLSRMINDMLDLDRMESGKMSLGLDPVDLNAIIREVAELCQPQAPDHTIRLDLAPDLPQLPGDRDRLHQVMLNLVSNAIKYSPNGCTVTIASRLEGEAVHVSVEDEGVGIPVESIDKIFDRYSRAGAGRDRTIEGTGLGLPITRQIVQMHGGSIWAESEPEEGSTFHFTIPVRGGEEV